MNPLFVTQLADGPGTPIVLSHALGLDHSMWLSTAEMWQGERPVLAYDHRGHGRSQTLTGRCDMGDLVDDAIAVIEGWGHGKVVFIGLSMGGMVGQGLAIRRPDLVRGLVLAHTAARYPEQGRQAWAQRIAAASTGGMAAVVDVVLQRYLTERVRRAQPQIEADMREQLLRNDVPSYAACCDAVANVDWLDELPRIECPTLVLAGAHDIGAPPAMAQEVHERIAGSQIQVFDQASHLSPVEQPDAFRTALRRFISMLETDPGSQVDAM